MGYKIVLDSCGEITEEMRASGLYSHAPLEIFIDDYKIRDDETFDQQEFLKRAAASPNCPKSNCPSPQEYMELYKGEAKRIYVVTLSAELSGSHNSAELGRKLYEEENEGTGKQIYVFNSRSASIGQTLIALKVQELEAQGLDFDAVVAQTEAFIEGQNTYFVLESLETLRKNGRLSNIKAFVATALKIKPVMAATPEGTIIQLDQACGINKALIKMIEYMAERTTDTEKKILAISHCNCAERAQMVKQEIEKRVKFKEIFILDTRGISSMYASDGGIIISV